MFCNFSFLYILYRNSVHTIEIFFNVSPKHGKKILSKSCLHSTEFRTRFHHVSTMVQSKILQFVSVKDFLEAQNLSTLSEILFKISSKHGEKHCQKIASIRWVKHSTNISYSVSSCFNYGAIKHLAVCYIQRFSRSSNFIWTVINFVQRFIKTWWKTLSKSCLHDMVKRSTNIWFKVTW